ncbi:MAG: recJ [Rickettsiales bacterium]|nr:recJ [Rickettsiales bacterium]
MTAQLLSSFSNALETPKATGLATFLNNLKPVNGVSWRLRNSDERLVLALSQRLDIPEIVAKVLAGRQVPLETAADFLEPTLKKLLPDPFHLLDMDKAAVRIVEAIQKREHIAVFGDYDVDGATSSALLKRFFQMIGHNITIYIPDRIKEGYGPNIPALLSLRKEGVSLVITVDCGTVSFEPLKAAKDAGLDVIVIDHHLGAPELPEAVAVVNPNRLDETSPHRHMAAVGVSFLLAVAVNARLREAGLTTAANLLSLLDLVALGTVCDVMPLTGINRAFVTQGLKILSARQNLGLRALCDIAKLDSAPTAYHLGFVLGPRINAGGRVGKSDLGAILLSTADSDVAFTIAPELDRLNLERKVLEEEVLAQAMEQGEAQDLTGQPLIFAQGKGWHPGVIGIIASRLKERFHKPAIVIAIDEKGIGKASARSVAGVDFGATVGQAKLEGLLLEGGGHAMAAGFSVEASRIPALVNFFATHFAKGVAAYQETRGLECDAILTTHGITPELAALIERAGPFGVGNPTPRFILAGCYLAGAEIVGKDHIRCFLGSEQRTGNKIASEKTGSLKAMAFRAVGTPLGDFLLGTKGTSCHVVGQLRLNHWQGRTSAEFTVEDIAPAQ